MKLFESVFYEENIPDLAWHLHILRLHMVWPVQVDCHSHQVSECSLMFGMPLCGYLQKNDTENKSCVKSCGRNVHLHLHNIISL